MTTAPFIVMGLPRSRTAWLSRFLTYGDWVCGHDEVRFMRGMDDLRAWFRQPCVGTVETAITPYWRLIEKIAPQAKIVVVRRHVDDVVESLLALPGVSFDRDIITKEIRRFDSKLSQVAARMECLVVEFEDLDDEATCRKVFEYCLPCEYDHEHWERLKDVNIQVDMSAIARYCDAYGPQLEKLAATARHLILSDMVRSKPVEPDGICFQTDDFDTWVRDAEFLFNDHLIRVGEAPGDWQRKNLPLMRKLYEIGAMQIMTARCNGRMFGYLMTLISPSLVSEGITTGTHTTFFADDQFPGLGMKLQRAALHELKARGVDEVFWEAGKRGSGPRLGTMYRRLGAVEHGHTYRLELKEVA